MITETEGSNEIVLKVENLSKVYRLGQIGTGTISHDLNRWWAKFRGKEDPFATVGVANDRSQKDGTNEFVKVLNDINFEVKKGEVLGIIGKNGAGKSTLLKVISQITSPTTGSVKAKGRIASLLEVGTGMHPEMTGKENVYLNGTILGMTRKEIDVKFDEIMDFAGCAKYADTPVKRYSSGMKVRLGFAVAAFLEPEILIVDEVLAVGDAEFQKKAIGKMQDISKGDGRTVLFVSHNLQSVSRLCQRVCILESGENIFLGETGEGLNIYERRNIQQFRPITKGEVCGFPFSISLGNKKVGFGKTGIFDLSSELYLRIEFEHSLPPEYHVCFHVKKEEQIIFTCGNFGSKENVSTSNWFGFLICLNAASLNQGNYVIDLLLVKDKTRVEGRCTEVVSFAVNFKPSSYRQYPEPGLVQHHLEVDYL